MMRRKRKSRSENGCWEWVLGRRSQALGFIPWTSGLGHRASDIRPKTQDLRPKTSDPRPQTQDLRPKTSDPRPNPAISVSRRFHRGQFLRERFFFHLRAGDEDYRENYNRASRQDETVDALVQN